MKRREFMNLLQGAATGSALGLTGMAITHNRSIWAADGNSNPGLQSFFESALTRIVADDVDASQFFALTDKPVATFSDYSIAGEKQRRNRLKNLLAELHHLEVQVKSPADRVNYSVLKFFLKNGDTRLYNGALTEGLGDFSYPNLQNYPRLILLTLHPIRDEEDVQAYMNRLRAVPRVIAQAEERIKAQHQRGVIPPDFSIDLILRDLEGFISVEPAKNLLTLSAIEKMSGLDLADRTVTNYSEEISTAVSDSVYPAYRSFINLMKKLRIEAGSAPGLCRFDGGLDYYQHLLTINTTTRMQPDEIHEIGLQGIEKIHEEIRELFKELGLKYDSLAEGFDAMANDPKFRYPDTQQGRAQIIADCTRYNEEIRKKAKDIFAWLPGEIMVKPVPPELEATTTTSFMPGAADGSTPGTFFVHMKDVLDVPNFEIPIITYHEGIPGHGLQVSRARALRNLPSFRSAFDYDAYVEGWAKYAEKLPFEMGYNTDPWAILGRWRLILYSTTNLALDTGVHAKGWDYEKAVEFFRTNAFVSRSYAEDMVSRRIVANPAQTCSYKIGHLKFVELRNRMKSELGDRFSYRDFHSTVLDQGSMPLSTMEEVVNDAIKETG